MKRKLAHCYPTNCRVAGRRAADGNLRASPALIIGHATRPALSALLLVLGAKSALAVNADEYLFTPTVTQGERELDWHFGTGSSGESTAAQSDTGLAFGLGVTQHWFTELDIEYRRQSPVGTRLDAFEWENTLQVGEPGEWPVDIGMEFNVEKPYQASSSSLKTGGWSARFGPLLQKDIGKVQVNFNLLIARFFQSSGFSATQLSYQSQIKYRYSQPLEMGIQAFGRLSSSGQTWTAYSEQVHRVGPVVLGRLVLPGERSLSYNIAFLLGTTAHSPDRTLRFQFEYEF